MRRVLVNLSASVLAQAFNRLFPIITYAVAQRRLGDAAFGHALFACQLVDWTSPFIDAGTANYGQIEVGRDKDDAPRMRRLLGSLISIRLMHAVVAMIAFAAALDSVYPAYFATAMALSFMLVTSALDVQYVQYGTQRIWALVVISFAARALSLGLIATLVRDGDDATTFAVLLIAGNSLLSVGSLIGAVRRWRPTLPTRAELKAAYRRLAPFMIFVLMLHALEKFDFNLIEAHLPPTDVGHYGGMIRMYLSLLAVVPALAVAFGSEMLSTRDPEIFARHADTAMAIIAIVVLPIAAGAWTCGGPLLALVFDDSYRQHGPAFALLCAALIPHAVFVVLGIHALMTRGALRATTAAMALGLAAGIGVGALLVPRLGILGGALAVLIAKSTVAAIILPAARSLFSPLRVARLTWPSVAAALLMAAGLAAVAPKSLAGGLLTGGAIYAAALAALGTPTIKRLLAQRVAARAAAGRVRS